jgi:hypothetical protein
MRFIAITAAGKLPQILCASSALVTTSLALGQTTLRVHGDDTIGLTIAQGATGADWDHAFLYLADAIAEAALNATPQNPYDIWVAGSASGIHYYPDEGDGITNNDPDTSFALLEDVSILGGFLYGHDDVGDRMPLVNRVILNGDLQQNDSAGFTNYGDNAVHVVSAHTTDETAILDGVTIRGGNAGTGGGVWSKNSSARIINCRITQNQASGLGGGVGHEGSANPPPELRLCDISNNRATGSGQGCGVGVSASVDLIACRLTENTAAQGGAILAGSTTTNVYHCIILNNAATSTGGAIHATGSSSAFLSIANTLIALNEAPEGAGVLTDAQIDVAVLNSTLADNAASTSGGGMYILTAGDTVVSNCIFWGNTASSGAQIYNPSSNPLVVSYSDVQGGGYTTAPHSNNMNSNPLFVGGGVYALSCSSPCLDAGSDPLIPDDAVDVDEDANFGEDSPFDVAGNAREVDAVASTTYDVDMGAYEGQDDNTCEGDANRDGVVDVNDLITVILEWGTCVSPATGCLGDLVTHPCGDGEVDVDDLISVILNWGDCPTGFGMASGAPIPQDLQDCMNQCAEEAEYGSDKWHECVEACMQALDELE